VTHLIYGSREFGAVLKDFLDYHGLPWAGFIDDVHQGPGIVGTFDQVRDSHSPGDFTIVLGVGYRNLAARWGIFEKVRSAGFTVATLIHRHSFVRRIANIGEGAIVMANATVDANAVIGEAAVLWPGVVVNHDSRIGSNTFLSPSCTICGSVTVGPHSFVGAGSVIADHTVVPEGSFIKAHTLFKSPSERNHRTS
jgi:sugar O-acyltransferase (sialic acid O-acetyltransferase NeuD family)